MLIIDTEPKVIKSWCENPETGAINQAKNLANLPFIFRQVCLMPDTHEGYGMPIGGVIATHGVVIPNAVGVDIGCGMIAAKTKIMVEQFTKEKIKSVLGKIREVVPVGFDHQKEKQSETLMPEKAVNLLPIVKQEYQSALRQIGTLGGGNHFIELQKDEKGFVWIMIHSGSRNLGKKVADHHNRIAVELNQKWHSKVPKEWQLDFLPIESEEGQIYLSEMNYCVDFAFANRKLMMKRICQEMEIPTPPFINIAHNYAAMENHFGSNVMIHRKGATLARDGQIGIIPGSQGTASYIVCGLGNKESFQSCSHGAGRKMSRTKARNELNLEEEQKRLNDQGIIHSVRNKADLDEASSAYKDIDVVMEEQRDLVVVVHKLTPLAVIKG